MILEKSQLVDQKSAARLQRVRDLLAAEPTLFAGQGAVVEGWRVYRGKRLGPYFRVVFRRGRRQHSLDLGRDRELAGEVARLLEERQAPRQHRQNFRHQRRRRQSLAAHKALWRQELAARGLSLKGNEIRGWRLLPSRLRQQALAENPLELHDE